jgi:WD40 repeat protein
LADLTDETGLWLRLAWSPDGARLAVGSAGGETLILDADTGSTVVDLGSFMEPVRRIVWADNGQSLVIAAEHCIRLVDALTGGTFDEIRPEWAVSDMTIIAGHDRRPYLVVTGNRSSLHRRNNVPKAGAPDDGRLLLLDLSRRHPADAARDLALVSRALRRRDRSGTRGHRDDRLEGGAVAPDAGHA